MTSKLLTYQEARIIAALANNKLSARRVARALNYHHNTIYYHVCKIRNKTNLDPYNFWDMEKLVPMAKSILNAPEIQTFEQLSLFNEGGD